MITFQKNKKHFLLSEGTRRKINQDINKLAKLQTGIYAKTKEFDFAFYIKITINKNKINIDSTNKSYALLPDTITFLIVLDSTYPNEAPKIFCRTNVRIIIYNNLSY